MRIIGLLLLIVIAVNATAQSPVKWADAMPVADKIYGNIHPRIALDNNKAPMVIWGNTNGKLYFTNVSDHVFATPKLLNPPLSHVFAESWAGAEIVSYHKNVYIVYQCEQDEDNTMKNPLSDTVENKSAITQKGSHIYSRHSYDGGNTFSIPEQVDHQKGTMSRFPAICTDDDGNPIIAYLKSDTFGTNTQPALSRSYDMGDTYTHDTGINDPYSRDISDCSPPAIACLGDNAALLYRNNINYFRNTWAGISFNKGYSFSKDIRMDSLVYMNEHCYATPPAAVINGDTIFSVYTSGEGDASQVYLSWVSMADSTFPVSIELYPVAVYTRQNFPRIAHSGYTTAISWIQSDAGNNQVCVAFTDSINTGIPTHFDTIAEGTPVVADIAMTHSNIYVVWQDNASGTVMMRTGTYINKNKAPEAVLNPIKVLPGKTLNLYYVNRTDITSIVATDGEGKKYDVDFICTDSDCKISAEDLDAGSYKIELIDKEGKKYHSEIEVK